MFHLGLSSVHIIRQSQILFKSWLQKEYKEKIRERGKKLIPTNPVYQSVVYRMAQLKQDENLSLKMRRNK